MASTWNLFVKKIYHEGRGKNKNYSFKQALKDASKRKGEMSTSMSKKNIYKNKKHKSRRHRTMKKSH
jgi:hypothetical protein